MDTITIAGQSMQVPVRYEEGHELTVGEASALNQTFHENIRNNMAKKLVEGLAAGVDLATLQAQVSAYAESYAFGVRTGGGGATRDPVMSEAMNIARKIIRDKIKAKGVKLSAYTAEAINGAAKKLLDRPEGAQILELAKQRVAEAQSAAQADLGDLLGEIPTKPAEAPAAPAQPAQG